VRALAGVTVVALVVALVGSGPARPPGQGWETLRAMTSGWGILDRPELPLLPLPAGVTLPVNADVIVAGRRVCRAAVAPFGWYSAAHCCGRGLRLLPDGVTPWGQTKDPTRDLVHLGGPKHSVAFGDLTPGVAVRITGQNRAEGRLVYWGELDPDTYPAQDTRYSNTAFCYAGGRRMRVGDSGGGLYREDTGGLVAVVTHASEVGVPMCDGEQLVRTVPVP
jgi:hypothetical protein